MKIEYQYFDGCPACGELKENLKTALDQYEGEVDYNEILVETIEKAMEIGFRGSPTLVIDGEDFEGMPKPESPGLACRVYKRMPTAEIILQRMRSLV